MKQEKFNLTKAYRPKPEDFQTLNGATYPIKPKWDVVIEVIGSDDESFVFLNNAKVLNQIFEEPPKQISLQNLLRHGNNTVNIQLHNKYGPKCSIHYKIGVYDESGKPRYQAIDITLVGETPHPGKQWDLIYEFPMI